MNKKGDGAISILIFIFIIGIIAFIYFSSQYSHVTNTPSVIVTSEPLVPINNSFSVASFNLQIYGDKKANDSNFINSLYQTYSKYDVIAFQEIRDVDGSAVKILKDKFSPTHNCIFSDRLGRTTSKEQYAFCYNSKFVLNSNGTMQDNVFERPPMIVYVSFRGKELQFFIVHLKPEDVAKEFGELAVTAHMNGDSFYLGDFNADCSYYYNDNSLFKTEDGWVWVIPDTADTTSGSTDCAYDRIITDAGVLDYSIIKDMGNMSDHYGVAAVVQGW